MATRSSMLHVRIDNELKVAATDTLARFGLSVSDAVRILLTRVTQEGGLPAGLTADSREHDAWFRAKVQEALASSRPLVVRHQARHKAQAATDRKRRAGT